MTNEAWRHPDLLRRFVATPYVFDRGAGSSRVCVESNDLEIALSIRRSSFIQCQGGSTNGLLCKLIRDMASPAEDSEILIITDGMLRILHLGMGTILIHDRERSELLGFISRTVRAQELVSSLIPALLGA